MDHIVDKVWEGSEDAFRWVRALVFGEFEENRPLSVVVTDAFASFTPGLGSLMTLRDLVAIVLRLARHPEKRAQVDEWILLIAMLLPLIITLVGLAAAGVGALVGAELGGFFRALTLLLVKEDGVGLKALVEFFQHHGYGDVVAALKKVQFAAYRDAVVKGLSEQIDKLIRLVKGMESKLRALSPHALPQWIPGRTRLVELLEHCPKVVSELEALRVTARSMIPKALIELDRRLGALLAGNLRAATEVTHSIRAGEQAPAVARAVANPLTPGYGRSPAPLQPGNTRRIRQRRIAPFHVHKNQQEFRFVNSKGVPVGAKPYHEGKTVVENPKLEEDDWVLKHASSVDKGYPDLTAPDYRGRPTTKYDTFSDVRKVDLKPGDKLVRIVSHDAEPRSDYGEFWSRNLPEDGREMRASAAVKEVWNKNGNYVEMNVPPKGHPVWQELGQDPANPILKGWQGPAASQRYEYMDPETGKMVKDDFYLPGGEDQLVMDGKQMEILKKHGFVSERKPTGFKDYDPNAVNTDGSKGNIVPHGYLVFENVPLDQALIRANAQGKP